MAVLNYSPKQGVLGTRQAQRARHLANQGRADTMPLAEIAARLSAQENALTTKAIGGVLGLVNQAREYDYPDTALGWASLPAKAVTGIAKGMMDIPGEMIDDANNQVAGLSDGRKVTEGAFELLGTSALLPFRAPAGSLGMNAKMLADAGLGSGRTFLDDVVSLGFEGAVAKRAKYFSDEKSKQADDLAKARDPNARKSGIKPTYAGTFGGDKTIPVDQMDAYDVGLSVSDHPLAGPAQRRALTVDDIEGRTVTALAGDQSRVGQINKIKGDDVGAIDVLGGRDNARFGYGWQSDANKMGRVEDVVMSKPDESVLGGLLSMGGAATDFQHTTADILAKISDPKAITKKDAKVIDKLINPAKEKGGTKFKDYPGIKSDEFMPWFLKQSNTARSGMIKSLTTTPASLADEVPKGVAPYELIPGFDIPATRHAMTEPDMINRVAHKTDPSIRDFNYFDAGAQKVHTNTTNVPHLSFVDAIPGGVFGRLENDAELPMSLIFDDYVMGTAQRGLYDKKPGLQNSAFSSIAQNMPMRAPEGSGIKGLGEPSSVITPEKAEDIMEYYRLWDKFR
jgi:hypothetical protein